MQKTLPVLCAACLFFGTAAHAQENNSYVPYAGIDYSYLDGKMVHAKPHYQGIGANLGTKYNDYFGTELFYQQVFSDSKKTEDGKFKSSYRAYGLDIAAYLPLGCYHTVDLFATAGAGEYVFNKKFNGGRRRHDSGWGYRIGAGFMYNFSENISLRAVARYVSLDKVSDFDHLVEYSAGLRYHFYKD